METKKDKNVVLLNTTLKKYEELLSAMPLLFVISLI
jgi:hypothetical protein